MHRIIGVHCINLYTFMVHFLIFVGSFVFLHHSCTILSHLYIDSIFTKPMYHIYTILCHMYIFPLDQTAKML